MKLFTILFLLLVACQACNNTPNLETEKKQILAIHSEQRRAHMEKNVALLLAGNAADYIEVNRGQVKKPLYADNFKRFTSYFESVDLIKWDDVAPPVISFSDDASMATSVVDKLVVTRSRAGDNRLDTFHYAWLAVFKKVNGKWRLHRMGSTNK